MSKISFFNKAEVSGLVEGFDIKSFPSGVRLANIRFKDETTNNVTYVQIFDRPIGIAYKDGNVSLEGLKNIFMDSNNKPRGLYAAIRGKCRETQTVKNGVTTTYVNFTAFQINPTTCDNQYAILFANGVVESVARFEQNDEEVVKIKLGICNTNKDKDINGCDFVTVVARGNLVDKLEDVEKGWALGVKCHILNELPKRDDFGDIISQGAKEIAIAKIVFATDRDELDDVDFANYQKSKTLAKGQVIKVDNATKEVAAKPSKDEFDDDLDF